MGWGLRTINMRAHLTNGGLDGTLVHVLRAVGTSEGGRAGTGVGVHPVHTGATILAAVVVAIVYIHLTVPP